MPLSNTARRVLERTTPIYKATLRDEDGNAIELADLDAITLTLYDQATGEILNGREGQDVKNANGVTIHATSGLLTWQMAAADNAIVGSPAAGEYEVHIALFEWTYDGGKQGKYEVQIDVRQLAKVDDD